MSKVEHNKTALTFETLVRISQGLGVDISELFGSAWVETPPSVFVIEGTLELHTEAYTPVRLDRGDSVYFDSSMGHVYVAIGEAPCRILSVCATTEEQFVGALEAEAERKHVRPDVRRSADASSNSTAAPGAAEKRRSRLRAPSS